MSHPELPNTRTILAGCRKTPSTISLIPFLAKKEEETSLPERRKLLLSMLDGVYFDTKGEKALVAIKPNPAFVPIFQVAVTRARSQVVLLKEEDLPPSLPESTEAGLSTPCSWWRRGEVELHLDTKLAVLLLIAGVGRRAGRLTPVLSSN